MSNGKNGKWKFWGTVVGAIIVAGMGAYATINTAIIQNTGAKQSSVEALARQNQETVKQINEVVIPGIQKITHDQTKEIITLREKLAMMRGEFNEFRRSAGRVNRRNFRPNSGALSSQGSGSEPEKAKIERLVKEKMKSIPKLHVQQTPELEELTK